jgi:hypothetical protein
MKMKKIAAALLVAGATFAPMTANAVSVGLELLLLVDVSGSVDANEYNLQKTGYVNAFNSAAVQNAIFGSQGGSIAVSYAEWSGAGQLRQLVNWMRIGTIGEANAFAAAINGTSRAFNGSTAIQSAISNSKTWFGMETGGTSNGFESLRQVMDVSGDGENNDGLSGTQGRDAALAAGVDTINGIYIGGVSLGNYYNNSVKGGTGGFVEAADNFSDFSAAIERKLIREITNETPEPLSAALVGIGLFGLGLSRRRQKQVQA